MWTTIEISKGLSDRLLDFVPCELDFDDLLMRLMDERFAPERITIKIRDTTKDRLASLGVDGQSFDEIIRSLPPLGVGMDSPPLTSPLGVPVGHIPPPPPR